VFFQHHPSFFLDARAAKKILTDVRYSIRHFAAAFGNFELISAPRDEIYLKHRLVRACGLPDFPVDNRNRPTDRPISPLNLEIDRPLP